MTTSRAIVIGALLLAAGGGAAQPLDLSDPAELVDAYVRTVGDTSGEESFVYASVVVLGMTPDEQGKKLFGLEVLGASRFVKIDGGYQRLHREVGLYTDLETGDVLAGWTNPYLGRDVEVIHIQNDPVNFQYTVAQQDTGRRILYDDFGSHIAFHREIPLRYPSPLDRAGYPRHSAGDWYVAAELFNSFARRDELEDRSKTSVAEFGTWSRVGPWLPWMEMADRPGHLLYHGRSTKLMSGPGELPPKVLQYIEANMPEYLHAPTVMASPNQTSWTYFKQVLDERRAAQGNGQHVLVFGGTGRTGIEIVRQLRARGADVTVFVRPTSDRAPLESLGVAFVVGDAMSADDVRTAFTGRNVTAVVSAIGKRPQQQVRPDYVANANIVAAAKAAGVERLLQISSVGAGDSRQYLETVPDFMVPVLEAKTNAESALIDSDLRYTILRPGRLYDGPATGRGEASTDQSIVNVGIRRSDLAELAVDVLFDAETAGNILHVYDHSAAPARRE